MDSLLVFNEREQSLVEQIKNFSQTNLKARTKLETDEKVLARVTDGIYRLPGSAIRELISNAYDADAENVVIDTDVPRFETISVRDDGNGMSVETLVNLLSHIGGSAKRTDKGSVLKVTDDEDSSLSRVKKRKVIGKIGIGLFSVAQLTRDFDIITKQKNTNFYLKARIRLHNYSEEYIQQVEKAHREKIKNKKDLGSSADGEEIRGASFETGDVEIWTEHTSNLKAHGTDLILRNIKKSARDQLRSVDIWGQETAETERDIEINQDDLLNSSKLEKPSFHVGNYFGADGFEYYEGKEREPELPWSETDDASVRLKKLYDELLGLTKVTTNPKLGIVFDSYLNMLWSLSLSVPLNYIDKHPFDYSLNDVEDVYIISNKLKGQATRYEGLDKNQPLKNILPPQRNYRCIDFKVIVDGIELFRPLRFTGLPKSGGAVKRPILFVGSYSPDLSSISNQETGGKISFDAYLLWTPKVIPKDHNGVLVRVNNSSGTLFDETFMKHQVAEHTIKSQLTVEIFVHDGLDSALNIDRESFNISHPHYQIIMKWLHQAIRQVVNKYKAIKKEEVAKNNLDSRSRYDSKLSELVLTSIQKSGMELDDVSNLYLIDSGLAYSTDRNKLSVLDLPMESIKVDRGRFIQLAGVGTHNSKKGYHVESKVEAILQVLESYKVLSNLSVSQRESLIEDLIQIVSFEG
ncbi:ATP-binding protein [Pseudomonas capsici]|uniref:ATP-binding protein n=1 Tax=Pseudomonas capsici TaxID=2810614 RepID=UPI0021F1C8CD|nr:ATP-binding protein [Pseudomonas capsici]MCV4285719.1 ATP-binding protein [Pseudomonas capsici]